MSWNYDVSDLATSEVFQVRLLVGDTDSGDQLLQDEEIERFISTEGSVKAAAEASLDAIANSLSRAADKQIGPLKISLSQRAVAFRKAKASLAAQRAITASPVLTGRTHTQKDAAEEDSDLVQPAFTRDQFDNPLVEAIDDEETA